MSGSQVKMQLLVSRNDIIGSIHGGGRASLVVESPAVPSLNFYATSKVDHIEIGQCLHLVCFGWGIPEIVRPSSCTSVQIAGMVTKRRIECGQEFDAWIQTGCYNRESASLASTGYTNGRTVKFRQRINKVHRFHTTHVHSLVIMAVAVVLVDFLIPTRAASVKAADGFVRLRIWN